MPKNQVRLHQLFLRLQNQMQAELDITKCIPHEGAKGDACEVCWLEMLKKHLPSRYRAERAFVVDCDDRCSDQIDIVIFDRHYSPFLFEDKGQFFVPAESVYAVIEAKQKIDKRFIEYAAMKAASVRKLRRTTAEFKWLNGPGKRKDLFDIAAGIVAPAANWNPAFGKPFQKIVKSLAEDRNTRIDFGCAIDPAAFDVEYDDHGTPTFSLSPKKTALMWFFMRLLARLQRMGTVPAIEIDQYLKRL